MIKVSELLAKRVQLNPLFLFQDWNEKRIVNKELAKLGLKERSEK